MRTPILVTTIAGLVLLAALNTTRAPVHSQDSDDSLINNPDLLLPRQRIESNVQYSLREARNREIEARRLENQGKGDEALDRWRDALARYEALRREHLRPDMPLNTELLVRVEWVASADHLHSETWQPLADYINSRYRASDWPRPLREQLALRQAAPAADLLSKAIAESDEAALRKCARFYQFSEAGRSALRMLAELALERGDAVTAVRWLEELQGSWPEHFERDAALQVLFVRACREADMRYRLGHELRRRERAGAGGTVDIGGRQLESAEAVAELAAATAPMERPELRPSGWLTTLGDGSRNGVAPPVLGIGAMVDLDPAEGVQGRKLATNVPGTEEQTNRHSSEERPAVPVPYPVAHQAGLFVHRIDESQSNDEKILWFRHGRESSPVTLEVPASERYTVKQTQVRHWYSSSQAAQRSRYRVLGSSIGRLRWELDNRESDVLFAVMGSGNPSRESGAEPTGNQIQAWDVTDDAKLRVTLPNRKIESEEEIAFLRHVVFSGAPLIRGNFLYIAGSFMEKDSVEIWLCCFDVTPKGDSAQGEGKLQWRVHLCSQRQQSQPWRWTPVTLPEVSSPSEQGGMIYVSTHAGATAAVDRVTGELCWVSKYGRMRNAITHGWFPGPPVAASGMLVATPYDYDLALILDSVWGLNRFSYPLYRMGPRDEFEHVLGIADNCMIIQGRTRLYSVGLTDYLKQGERNLDFGSLNYQSAEFGKVPTGRGVIAGDRVLVPFENEIAFYDLRSGKLLTRSPLTGVTPDNTPFTLTVYCRGEAYQDEHEVTRYKAVTVTDPDTGSVYNVEYLRNGDEFVFPSGKSAKVHKETFVILASARWMYVFEAHDGGDVRREKPAEEPAEKSQSTEEVNKEEGQE